MPNDRPLVIHVVRQFLPNHGGLEDVVANLCRHLPGCGYRTRVVTLDRLFAAPEKKLPERETILDLEIVRIPWHGSTRYPIAPAVFRHLEDADIVHVHAIDFFFDALAWGRFLHRKPLVATTHGGFFHTKRFSGMKTVWFNTLSRISSLAYRRIVCCSEADKRTFDRIASSRTVLVENGVDTKKFADAAAQTPTRALITIGRFSANKQLMRLLDTLLVLVRRNREWRLTIAGVPSDLTESDVRKGITDRSLEANTRLVVGSSNEEIRRMMNSASLFVSASEYEGFGLVAIEAMSAGLIPVLEPNGAFSDLARKHDCVKLAAYANAAGAADSIEAAYAQLLTDFEQMRRAAFAAADEYAWQTVSKRYAAEYDGILCSSKSG
jgi:alpha-1,3-mannosyltransferase